MTLREATRRVGVAPNAAYRHFTSQHDLLLRGSFRRPVGNCSVDGNGTVDDRPGILSDRVAKASLRAIGTGYLRFARAEPGLFRTAFGTAPRPGDKSQPDQVGNSGLDPFQLLGSALDRMQAAGVLPPARRVGCRISGLVGSAWACHAGHRWPVATAEQPADRRHHSPPAGDGRGWPLGACRQRVVALRSAKQILYRECSRKNRSISRVASGPRGSV